MTSIREQCGCGGAIRVDHSDDPMRAALIASQWRTTHTCDRRGGERDITAGATTEVAYTEPHPTDSRVYQPLGFTAPPSGVWVTHWHDGADPAVHPDEATARRVAHIGAGEKVRFLPYGACLTDIIRSAKRSA